MFKKIISSFVTKIAILALGIIVPFILIIKKFKNFIFFEVETRTIGIFPVVLETIIRENKKNINENKTFYFLYFAKPIANEFLLELYIREIKKIENIKILKSYLFWKRKSQSYQFWTKKKISIPYDSTPTREDYKILTETPRLLKITKEENDKGLKILNSLGLDKDSKWICVGNRDAAYLDWFWSVPDRTWRYHDYRDWPINDMHLAFEYFLKKGYYVVRIGKKSNEKIEMKNPKIIDFVHHDLRTDFSEIFLISNCKFFFGSAGGMAQIPYIFRKPVFFINNCPMASLYVYPRKNPSLFKRLYDVDRENIISVKDMVNRNLLHIAESEIFEKKKIKLINNTPSEILSFAIEAEQRIDKSWVPGKDFKDKFQKFSQEISRDLIIKKTPYNNLIGEDFLTKTIIN